MKGSEIALNFEYITVNTYQHCDLEDYTLDIDGCLKEC